VTLAKLLEQTREGADALRAARDAARPACVQAVRKLEKALREALGGERLRGLPVLDVTPEGRRVHGARARGKTIDGQLEHLDAVLVIMPDGTLYMACKTTSWPVADEELLVEDVEDVARSVEEVLRRHLSAIARTTARFAAMTALAEKLEAALTA
jgi:hypothetical protein